MKKPDYWNHNTAYFSWINKQTKELDSILDVGCGDGELISCLDDGKKQFVGIDIFDSCIEKARQKHTKDNINFVCGDFTEYSTTQKFDCIVFVSSIHHMDMSKAIEKAYSMLNDKGKIIIVGLAKPSTIMDYLIEFMRVIPCAVISKLKRMKTSEDINVPVSYDLPAMNEVRNTLKPFDNTVIRQRLYYRYTAVITATKR